MKKLKILYDQQVFEMQKYGGISRYFANLAFELNKKKDIHCKISCLLSDNYYLQNFPLPFNNPIGKYFLRKEHKRQRWNDKYNITSIKKADYDVFHTTYYNPYFLEYLRKPFVLTVHDMIHEKYPTFFQDAEEVIARKKTLIEASSAIITISENTKKGLLKFFPHVASKTKVVYHGLPDSYHKTTPKNNYNYPSKFLLYVGERNHYKNFPHLIDSIADILKSEADIHLICGGGGSFNTLEQELLIKHQIENKCIQTTVSDNTLDYLYQNAIAFIYPSLEEGFGLPILEAFKNNCPVLCSNTSCLPEIGGDAVEYFDPYDSSSIQKTVQTILKNPDLRDSLTAKGNKQLKQFSFDACLERTIDVYKSL